MDKTLYKQLENHMLLCMDNSAHGKDHVSIRRFAIS